MLDRLGYECEYLVELSDALNFRMLERLIVRSVGHENDSRVGRRDVFTIFVAIVDENLYFQPFYQQSISFPG